MERKEISIIRLTLQRAVNLVTHQEQNWRLSLPELVQGETGNNRSGRNETILETLPLAKQGLSPKEISHLTGKTYTAVISCEYRLRRDGKLPASRQKLNKELVKELTNPPEDLKFRQKLLNKVNYSFYRRHTSLFATPSSCCRMAGLGHITPHRMDRVLEVLEEARVPWREFHCRLRSKGKEFIFHYHIILAADKERVAEALKNSLEFKIPA